MEEEKPQAYTEPVERYLTRYRNHFERHFEELEAQHARLLDRRHKALKQNKQEKAKKYDSRLDEVDEELQEFKDFIERLNELISITMKPLDDKTITEQLKILEFLKEVIERRQEA